MVARSHVVARIIDNFSDFFHNFCHFFCANQCRFFFILLFKVEWTACTVQKYIEINVVEIKMEYEPSMAEAQEEDKGWLLK